MGTIIQAFVLIAQSLHSIAHSLAIIAASRTGITADQAATIQKVTDGLNVSHDKLQDSINKL